METRAATPDPSDNPNDVVVGVSASSASSNETDVTQSPARSVDPHLDPSNPAEAQLPNSSETTTPSLPNNSTLDAPVSDSQDDSSDPTPPESQTQNPNPAEPVPPPRKRRRRKRFFTELNANPSLARNRRYRVAGGLANEVDKIGRAHV